MHPAEIVAQGFRYPSTTAAESLRASLDGLHGPVLNHMKKFVAGVEAIPLGRWEEIHTSTLDLEPDFVPYVGHVRWGESYKRGEFMAELNRSMAFNEVDLLGELPDHIEPVLRYLAVANPVMDELVEIVPKTVAAMKVTLKKKSPQNIYLPLLDAVIAFVADLRPLTIRASL